MIEPVLCLQNWYTEGRVAKNYVIPRAKLITTVMALQVVSIPNVLRTLHAKISQHQLRHLGAVEVAGSMFNFRIVVGGLLLHIITTTTMKA